MIEPLRSIPREFASRPVLYLALSAVEIIVIGGQEFLPVAGSFLAALSTALVLIRLHGRRIPPLPRLLGLTAFAFPLVILWPILLELYRNTTWFEPFSTAWSIPLLFAASVALLNLNIMARALAISDAPLGLAFLEAWKVTSRRARETVALAIGLTTLFALGLVTLGWGLLPVVPVTLALMGSRSFPREHLLR